MVLPGQGPLRNHAEKQEPMVPRSSAPRSSAPRWINSWIPGVPEVPLTKIQMQLGELGCVSWETGTSRTGSVLPLTPLSL